MAPFTLCVGIGAAITGSIHGPGQLLRAAANWDALALEQLLVGEADLPPHPGRLHRPDVATTTGDDPCLFELLREAAQRASHDSLLLVGADALLSRPMLANLAQLCRPGAPKRMLVGSAWRLREERLAALSDPAGDELIAAIDADAVLDGRTQPAWALLPRGTLLAAPADLPCEPQHAVPWLVDAARQLGWPVLDCSAAAPLVRPGPAPSGNAGPKALPATGVVLPHQPGAPLLSLLLAAPSSALEPLKTALLPTANLPWEVIARPAEADDGPGAIAAAWNSALAAAQAELAWPITSALPPLALIAAVLRSFEQPGLDLLLLAWELGDQVLPAQQWWHQEPGCLVTHTAWLRRLGGFDEDRSAGEALLLLRQQAQQRGASCGSLPLSAGQRAPAAAATAR